jgi:branched-chain amino acid transport system ATP-binding protein
MTSHNPAQKSAQNILEVRGITSGYGEKTVVRNMSLTLPAGGSLAILGPNGAGKTTFLKTCSGLLRATSGQVLIDGKDVTRASTHDRVKAGLCHIPDPRGIFPSLTVKENLILQAPRGKASEAITRAASAFPRLGQRLSQTAGTMSGGEQQMLAVARSYIQSPKVVLLDEVSMGLAPNLVDEIFTFLATLKAEGVALIVVEQFVHRAMALADNVVVVARGTIRLSGRSDQFSEDEIFAAYAGTSAAAGTSLQGDSAHGSAHV